MKYLIILFISSLIYPISLSDIVISSDNATQIETSFYDSEDDTIMETVSKLWFNQISDSKYELMYDFITPVGGFQFTNDISLTFNTHYESAESDSFFSDLLDGPHYTRPEEYRGLKVPDILLSGHHENIKKWQQENREKKTKNRRPDMWKKYNN